MQALAEVEAPPAAPLPVVRVYTTRRADLVYWTRRRQLLIDRMIHDAARPLWKPIARQVIVARIDALRMLDGLIAELSI